MRCRKKAIIWMSSLTTRCRSSRCSPEKRSILRRSGCSSKTPLRSSSLRRA